MNHVRDRRGNVGLIHEVNDITFVGESFLLAVRTPPAYWRTDVSAELPPGAFRECRSRMFRSDQRAEAEQWAREGSIVEHLEPPWKLLGSCTEDGVGGEPGRVVSVMAAAQFDGIGVVAQWSRRGSDEWTVWAVDTEAGSRIEDFHEGEEVPARPPLVPAAIAGAPVGPTRSEPGPLDRMPWRPLLGFEKGKARYWRGDHPNNRAALLLIRPGATQWFIFADDGDVDSTPIDSATVLGLPNETEPVATRAADKALTQLVSRMVSRVADEEEAARIAEERSLRSAWVIALVDRETGEGVFDVAAEQGVFAHDLPTAQRRTEIISNIRAGLLRDRVGSQFDVEVLREDDPRAAAIPMAPRET